MKRLAAKNISGQGLVANRQGFTLLEIMLVMVIISMAVGLVAPRMFAGSDSSILRGQIREVVSALRYAKRLAIIQGRPIAATIYAANVPKREAPKQEVDHPVSWLKTGVSLRLGDSTAMDKRKGLKIIFFPEGGSTGADLTFSYKGRDEHIAVNPVTGRVVTGSSIDK